MLCHRFFCLSSKVAAVLACVGVITTGCQNSRTESGLGSTTSSTPSVSPGATDLPPASPHVTREEQSCLVDHAEPIRDNHESTVVDPTSGKPLTRVGEPGTSQAIRVSLLDVLAQPEQFAGRLLHVEGNVSAMCAHRRAWFAIVDGSSPSGDALRVITAPRFLVPANAVGMLARIDGVIELRDLPAAVVQHQASEHGLAAPKQRVALLNANGAEFL